MFTHAAASFDPTDTSVLLWTRCTDPRPLTWCIEPVDATGPTPTRRGEALPDVAHDWCVTIDVDGLEPATSYRYWFEAGSGARSPVGRTRTLPADGVDEVRLAVVCCSDLTMGWFGAFRAIATEELDLVLHLGDAIYEETKGSVRGDDEVSGVAVTLGHYWHRHALTRADPDLQALHLRHPVVFVWDDHDVADNTWRHGAKAHDPDEHGPFDARLAAAAAARHDWMPARLEDPDDLLDMHRTVRIGDLAELLILDTRIPGRDEQADEPGSLPLDDPDRTMLGLDRRDWAAQQLRERTATWTVVATAVTLSPLELPIADDDVPVLDAAMPSGYAIIDGVAICTDEWDGYPAERQVLIDAMGAGEGGVLVLSGDVHSSWALEVRDDDDQMVAAEFVCPSITSTPMGRQLPKASQGLAEETAEGVPHRRWSDLLANGWLRLSLATDGAQADWFEIPAEEPWPLPDDERAGHPMASWIAHAGVPTELTEADGPLAPWADRGGVDPAWPPTPEPSKGVLRRLAEAVRPPR